MHLIDFCSRLQPRARSTDKARCPKLPSPLSPIRHGPRHVTIKGPFISRLRLPLKNGPAQPCISFRDHKSPPHRDSTPTASDFRAVYLILSFRSIKQTRRQHDDDTRDPRLCFRRVNSSAERIALAAEHISPELLDVYSTVNGYVYRSSRRFAFGGGAG